VEDKQMHSIWTVVPLALQGELLCVLFASLLFFFPRDSEKKRPGREETCFASFSASLSSFWSFLASLKKKRSKKGKKKTKDKFQNPFFPFRLFSCVVSLVFFACPAASFLALLKKTQQDSCSPCYAPGLFFFRVSRKKKRSEAKRREAKPKKKEELKRRKG
jgi:hypothetical protein